MNKVKVSTVGNQNQITLPKLIREDTGIKMPLEQTPAESTAYRLAKLDLKHFPLQSTSVIKGIKGTNEIYYTNSTLFNICSNYGRCYYIGLV